MNVIFEFLRSHFVDIISYISIVTIIAFILIQWKRAQTSLSVSKRDDKLYEHGKELETKKEQKESVIALEEKRNRFLNIPNISFHYADKERIKGFYNDYFHEPIVENVIREFTKETSGDIKGSMPKILEATTGGKDLSKWIGTIKFPDVSLNRMFLRYQIETIKKNQVELGLELVDIELSALQRFETIVSELRDKFGLQIDEGRLLEHRKILKEKAAEQTLIKLEQATGWVLMEGLFRVTEAGVGFYKCVYEHPVSQYISDSQKMVTISVLIPKGSIEPYVAGNYSQSIGRTISLRVYGEVWQPVNRNSGIWELQITPLCIY